MPRLAVESLEAAEVVPVEHDEICQAVATWVLGATGVIAGISWILVSSF